MATPIGNLEDITHRAVRILGQVALIACEDTRQTRKLLDHYGLATPLWSVHEHNEADRVPALIERLDQGESIALVSDAGTPLLSDPGFRLVSAARAAGLPVVPLPGPSAITAALCAAGLATDSFRFGGFLPPKSAARRAEFERWAEDSATLVYFESPHRILETLDDLAAVLPNRPIVLARELSKVHEEFLRGTGIELRAELARRPAILGEFTVLVGKEPRRSGGAASTEAIVEFVQQLQKEGVDRKDAMKRAARHFQIGKSEVYRSLTVAAGTVAAGAEEESGGAEGTDADDG